MDLTPMMLYDKAAKAVPSLKYALAVAGVVAMGMIAYQLANQDPKKAILTFVFVLAGMYLLLIFAGAAAGKIDARGPVQFLLWALTILFIAFLTICLIAFSIGKPEAIAKWLGAIPADARQGSAQPDSQSTTPEVVATVPVPRPIKPAPAAASAPVATAASATAAVAPVAAAASAASLVDIQETFRVSDSSEDCGANQTRTLEYCLPAGATVVNWSGPNIESANCGSALHNVCRLPGRDGCIAVDVSVRGCGYDNILGIKNCKGRGWIGGTVVINGQRPG
jgi:hypothetical protein